MTYRIDFTPRAARQLQRLPENIRSRLAPHITALTADPRPVRSKKLKSTEGYRLRVGDYRILYEINHDTSQVLIVRVGHCRNVYRGL